VDQHKISRKDLFLLVSNAKTKYNQLPNNPYVSGKEVEQGELPTVAVIEAFIMYLNQNGLLNKSVGFDFTDPADQYDVLED
jgi:hypothetical protein